MFQSVYPVIKQTFDNENWVMMAMEAQGFVKDENGVFQVPENGKIQLRLSDQLIPSCPADGGPVAMNLRADDTFVEDRGWHLAAERYKAFLQNCEDKKKLFLELGVGGNTPVLTASFARHPKSTRNDTVRPSYGYFMKEIGGGDNTLKVRAA